MRIKLRFSLLLSGWGLGITLGHPLREQKKKIVSNGLVLKTARLTRRGWWGNRVFAVFFVTTIA